MDARAQASGVPANFSDVLKRIAGLVVPAIFPILACASEPLWLAPGRSVTVVDGDDQAVRVHVAAPADEALDLRTLLDAARGNVPSLATLQHMKPAAALSRGADGSILLGAAPPATPEGRVIQGGVIVLHRTRYELQDEAPAAARQPADPIVEYTFGRDNVALPPSLSSLRTRVPPAVVPNLPESVRKPN